jgi:hypothetical protein
MFKAGGDDKTRKQNVPNDYHKENSKLINKNKKQAFVFRSEAISKMTPWFRTNTINPDTSIHIIWKHTVKIRKM